MVTPSGDREGFPVFFTHESRVHRLNWVVGPERIAGIWWTGHDKTRDYFDVTDETGNRFWIFRVLETWRWFLHGVF
jgi:protein ImuB